MNSKIWLLGSLLAAPGVTPAQTPAAPHEHGERRSAEVTAALDEAIARVPKPDWSALRESRLPKRGKAGSERVVELEASKAMSIVVVLDDEGAPHTECVESAPARDPQQ